MGRASSPARRDRRRASSGSPARARRWCSPGTRTALSAGLSPDGLRVATASADRSVRDLRSADGEGEPVVLTGRTRRELRLRGAPTASMSPPPPRTGRRASGRRTGAAAARPGRARRAPPLRGVEPRRHARHHRRVRARGGARSTARRRCGAPSQLADWCPAPAPRTSASSTRRPSSRAARASSRPTRTGRRASPGSTARASPSCSRARGVGRERGAEPRRQACRHGLVRPDGARLPRRRRGRARRAPGPRGRGARRRHEP